jgi:outer membrane protein assembly factor BamB
MKRIFMSAAGARLWAGAALLGLIGTPLFVGCQPPTPPGKGSSTTTTKSDAQEEDEVVVEPAPAEPMEEKPSEPVDESPAAPETPVEPTDKPTDEKPADEKPADEKPADEKPAEPTLEPPANKTEDAPADEPKPEEGAAQEVPGDQVASAGKLIPTIDKNANAPIKPGDWNQWGGTSYRNNTPIAKNIPTQWDPGTFDRKTGKWNNDGENIKWVAQVGSQTYGNPTVAGGKVMVGTNNNAAYLKRYPDDVDLGVLVCFDEKTGEFLWQHSCEKLPTGRVHDWPQQGICAASYVEGNRAWITTSRGEIVCVDINGFHDGKDDGEQNIPAKMFEIMKDSDDPTMDEVAPAIAQLNEGKLPAGLAKRFTDSGIEVAADTKVEVAEAGKKWTLTVKIDGNDRNLFVVAQGPKLLGYKVLGIHDKNESDVIWTFDMMKELGSSQHNMCSTSITCLGDILFCCTGNGVDESHINIPAIEAPSFFAIDKNTKEVYWTDNTPGPNIIHGQWSSPAVAELGGVWQVIYGGGDGWLYSFKADKGKDGKPELLWRFDLNPKEAKWVLGGRGTRNEPIGTPVVYDGLVYIAVGQDPEHGEGIGHMYCIDPTKRGDVSEFLAVKRDNPKEIVPVRRLVGVLEEEGEVAIPNPNTACVWHYSEEDRNGDGEIDFEEQIHRTIGTVAIQDDLLFIADFSGLFICMDAKSGKVHWVYDMLAASWGSPLIVDGHVYMGDEDGDVIVFKLSKEQHEPVAEINMGNSIYSTPIVANGVLYIGNKTHLFAITGGDAVAAE